MAWHGLVWCACVLSYDTLTRKLLPPKLVRKLFLKLSLRLRPGWEKIIEKYECQLFDSVLRISPHNCTRARSRPILFMDQ